MPAKLVFDENQLRNVVASSTSWWQVARKLRPEKPRGIYKSVQRGVKAFGLDTSHFTGQGPRPVGWTEKQLREAVAASINVAQVIRALRLIPAGGNYDQVQRRIEELRLDTSHFNTSAQGWAKGRTFERTAPIERLLVAGRPTKSHHLKKRLFRLGLKKPVCELCGWCERAADGRIPVELDHKNGDKSDNRIENLRILCPNCHSLQPTHRGLNQRRAKANRATDSDWVMRDIAPHYFVPRAVSLFS